MLDQMNSEEPAQYCPVKRQAGRKIQKLSQGEVVSCSLPKDVVHTVSAEIF